MEYNKVKASLGKKFYSYLKDDDTIDIARIVSVKNDKEVTIKFEDGRTEKIDPEELYKKYTELIPDGFVTFSLVNMTDNDNKSFNDVIVCLHRTKELDINDNEPMIVCRQNITDIFHNYLVTSEAGNDVIGVSVSRTTCPANINFQDIRLCDGIEFFIGVNFYITDSLDDMLDILGNKSKKFDNALETEFLKYLKFKRKPDIGQIQVKGRCRNLKTLLVNNDFEYDYNSVFNIVPLGIDMSSHIITATDSTGDYDTLDEFMREKLSQLYRINITKSIVIKYGHDINIDEIAGKYFLCRDSKNDLYIIMYTAKGEFFDTDLSVEAAKELMLKTSIISNSKK